MARLLWDGTALQDTEKCSDTFPCCRVVSCSANEADIKNTLKEGTEKMLSPLLPLPPWWKLHVNAPSGLTPIARRWDRGTKVVFFPPTHMPRKLFLSLYTALLSQHRFVFNHQPLNTNFQREHLRARLDEINCRCLKGYKSTLSDEKYGFIFRFMRIPNIFLPIKIDDKKWINTITILFS